MIDTYREPIWRTKADHPALYGVYGAYFQLEHLNESDEARLEAVHARLRSWLGSELRWTWASPFPVTRPFDPSDFELVELRCREVMRPGRAQAPDLIQGLMDAPFRRLFVAAHGGESKSAASPFNYCFVSEIAEEPSKDVIPMCAALTVTVPVSWPLLDFQNETVAIADLLRVRWATAGLMYGSWAYSQHELTMKRMFSHARRFHGFDVGFDAGFLATFHDRVRTVNWLTFLNHSLASRAGLVRARAAADVTVLASGNGVWLRAGLVPDPCDVNRLGASPAYRMADQLVRRVRCSDEIRFVPPWDDLSTRAWFRRFELSPP